MFRASTVRVASYALLSATFLFVANAACAPNTDCLKSGVRLDSHNPWVLETINGTPVVAPGYPIPGGSDRIRSGTLEFKTSICTSDVSAKGRVIAKYLLANAAGQPKFPSKTYAGDFKYNSSTGALTITAFGYSAPGKVVGTVFTLSANLSLLGAGKYTLVFAP